MILKRSDSLYGVVGTRAGFAPVTRHKRYTCAPCTRHRRDRYAPVARHQRYSYAPLTRHRRYTHAPAWRHGSRRAPCALTGCCELDQSEDPPIADAKADRPRQADEILHCKRDHHRPRGRKRTAIRLLQSQQRRACSRSYLDHAHSIEPERRPYTSLA